MVLTSFLLGTFVKIITGFDDVIVHIPVLAHFTKTRKGKVAFSIGTILAIIVAIFLTIFFVSFLKTLPYTRFITAGLLFVLAATIYFGWFMERIEMGAEKKLLKIKEISNGHFMRLIGIGFIASIITVLDDVIAYSPLFLSGTLTRSFVIAGIIFAALLEIVIVFYFAEKAHKIKYTKEIATISLVVWGILTLIGVI